MDFTEDVNVLVFVDQDIGGMGQVERLIDGDVEEVSFPAVIRENRKILDLGGFLIDANDSSVGSYLCAKSLQDDRAGSWTQFQASSTWLNPGPLKNRDRHGFVGRFNLNPAGG